MGHHHNAIEFQFIKRGQGAYFVNGRQYPLRKYSLLVIFPNQVHYFIPSPDGYIEKAHLIFPWKRLRNILGAAYFKPDFPRHMRLSESEAVTLELILNRIQEENNRREEYWTEIIEAKLKEFAFFVKRISLRPQPPHRENPVISQLVNYLEQHLSFRISSIAELVGFEDFGVFNRAFKQAAGLTPSTYRHVIQRKNNPGV
ncbi:MAG: AraC family ligand binding domain-containing protein [Verrucomicrobia bacterium]|nr:AraC family ligand binding domain-containing protein [Verrucomicrobiota bacterium]MBU4247868.1 AraC family ligand binding domain-containing protein [Verrucomicrobiota bacterium]MBU4429462.1 AraC family ligand binding domain-containing protein [Verrucomicrobiota bacterium]MCG2679659.1 AraC family ligand binding domain-containing protein [Kiritimatiellia bacterium]